uniref:NADAR domain-containing protein n=1 Tax=Tetranychus urticae TaxID=32264 RepID=T1L1P1_TETUR
MAGLDISSLFFTEDLLNHLYGELDINTNAPSVQANRGPFAYGCRSPNQITTIVMEGNKHRVLTYNSAQHYYQSERARMMCAPELADKVRRSDQPVTDGWVPDEDYEKHVNEWDRCKVDVAFKANWLKFNQNKDLAYELLLTGNRPMVHEDSYLGGVCWGKSISWPEINRKMLMIIREDLRRRAA